MPFTLSHAVAVLPLKKIHQKYRSMTGLVIGSMVPDFEYIIRLKIKSIYSHTLSGIVSFDLPLGMILYLGYMALVKNTLIDHLTKLLYQRLYPYKSFEKKDKVPILVIVISILLGTCTHLLWDGFTHPNGYFVSLFTFLSKLIFIGRHQLYAYKLMQHGSTTLGAVFIAIYIYLLPVNLQLGNKNILSYWVVVFVITATLFLLRLNSMTIVIEFGDLIVSIMAGICLGILIASIFMAGKKTINNP